MEKGIKNRTDRQLKRIVITGPESTGKTILAEQLAIFYGTAWIPEFAREYVMDLKRDYSYQDIVTIGKKQIDELTSEYPNANRFVFFDTGLIITQVWFLERYMTCPEFIDRAIREINIDLYLLCRPDIEWKVDPVRENSGADRDRLFKCYEDALLRHNAPYGIIEGKGEVRFKNAVQLISQTFCH